MAREGGIPRNDGPLPFVDVGELSDLDVSEMTQHEYQALRRRHSGAFQDQLRQQNNDWRASNSRLEAELVRLQHENGRLQRLVDEQRARKALLEDEFEKGIDKHPDPEAPLETETANPEQEPRAARWDLDFED